MTLKVLRIAAAHVALLALVGLAGVRLDAHITPVVVMRKQADVIRAALPGAVRYTATTVRISRPQLQQILDRGHFTPNTDDVKFYRALDANGQAIGTVLSPQVDTQDGPLEVGVAIGADGAVAAVSVTRATVEMKPWVVDVERSGALDQLVGSTVGDVRALPSRIPGAMSHYMAEIVATAASRALVLYATLAP